jgi:4-diphosphocytidyl-2-C-methyl-D-erythritol kinase
VIALPLPTVSPRGVHIRLRKRIPAGAGLGGGSSDAAAVLIGLRLLWGLDLSDRDLETLGATLGSDVPYFLRGGTALLTGTGTVIHPLGDLLGYEVLIVFPGTPLATRDVYAATTAPLTSSMNLSSMKRFEQVQQGGLRGEVETWVRAGNDLEPAASSLCPSIGEIKENLLRAGATAASMTGSGSAVFGIFRDKVAIGRALASTRAAGFAAWRCVPLGREDYWRRAGLP